MRARWASASSCYGDRYFINNDRGELIIAKHRKAIRKSAVPLHPTSIRESPRTGGVNWSHPAYANRNIVARNDEEIISISLEKRP